MKKLITLILVLTIGIFLSVNSNAQLPNALSTTIFHVGDNAAFSGTSIGFFIKVSQFPGSGSRVHLCSVDILGLNTTANTVSLYVNASTYAQATIATHDQFVGSVSYALGTTNVIGNHKGIGQGAVLASTLPGVSYLGDRGACFDFTDSTGRPTQIFYGMGFKPDNVAAGVAAWTNVRITYIKE